MSTLAERFKELTLGLKRGWQTRLAAHCGVSKPTVSDWASGEIKGLKDKNLIKVAEYFKVRPQWLAHGVPPKHINVSALAPAATRWPFTDEVLRRLQDEPGRVLKCENLIRVELDMEQLHHEANVATTQ